MQPLTGDTKASHINDKWHDAEEERERICNDYLLDEHIIRHSIHKSSIGEMKELDNRKRWIWKLLRQGNYNNQ